MSLKSKMTSDSFAHYLGRDHGLSAIATNGGFQARLPAHQRTFMAHFGMLNPSNRSLDVSYIFANAFCDVRMIRSREIN
jgi:hypothetical protein